VAQTYNEGHDGLAADQIVHLSRAELYVRMAYIVILSTALGGGHQSDPHLAY